MTQTGHWRLTSRTELNTSHHSFRIITLQWSGPTCRQFIKIQHTILLMYPQLKMPHCKFWKSCCRTKPQELVNARKVSQCAVKQAQIWCVCLMMQHDTQWVFSIATAATHSANIYHISTPTSWILHSLKRKAIVGHTESSTTTKDSRGYQSSCQKVTDQTMKTT